MLVATGVRDTFQSKYAASPRGATVSFQAIPPNAFTETRTSPQKPEKNGARPVISWIIFHAASAFDWMRFNS